MDVYDISKQDLNGRNFALKSIGELRRRDACAGPYVFDGIVIGVCFGGKAQVSINHKDYRVTATNMFVVLPKLVFSFTEDTPEFKCWLLFISPDFAYNMHAVPDFATLNNVGACPCVALDSGQMADIMAVCSMIRRYDGGSGMHTEIQEALTHAVSLMVASSFGSSRNDATNACPRKEDITRRFLDLLFTHGAARKSVAFYADKLCISPKYMTTAVKSVTGRSVQNWIMAMVLIYAKRYLKTTALTIQQITDKLCFQTTSSFIRFFKQNTGLTPLEYRGKAGKAGKGEKVKK